MPWRNTVSPSSSTPIRARSSHAPPSPACWPSMTSRSAWTAKAVAGQRVRRAAWRSVKYEEVYLHAYESVSAAREGIGRYLDPTIAAARIRALTGAHPRAYFGHPSMPPIRLAA